MGEDARAADLVAQARKKLASGGGLFGMFQDPQAKFEQASDLFTQVPLPRVAIHALWCTVAISAECFLMPFAS